MKESAEADSKYNCHNPQTEIICYVKMHTTLLSLTVFPFCIGKSQVKDMPHTDIHLHTLHDRTWFCFAQVVHDSKASCVKWNIWGKEFEKTVML